MPSHQHLPDGVRWESGGGDDRGTRRALDRLGLFASPLAIACGRCRRWCGGGHRIRVGLVNTQVQRGGRPRSDLTGAPRRLTTGRPRPGLPSRRSSPSVMIQTDLQDMQQFREQCRRQPQRNSSRPGTGGESVDCLSGRPVGECRNLVWPSFFCRELRGLGIRVESLACPFRPEFSHAGGGRLTVPVG